MKNKVSLKGMVMGIAVGDALGVPHEFSPRGYFDDNPITGMTGYGTHSQPPGTWSDDTSMVLCTLTSFYKGFDLDYLAKMFVKWKNEGFLTPHGDTFDIGGTVNCALNNYESGAPAPIAGVTGEMANGNGSLMRILPVLWLAERSDRLYDYAFLAASYSSVTHRHPRTLMACVILIRFAYLLVYAGRNEAMKTIKEEIYTRKLPGLNWQYSHFERLTRLETLTRADIKSTGYVIDTLEAALWCFIKTCSYKQAVLKAVNLGGDTDTIAAITGGLAGMYYGYDKIPGEWLNGLVAGDFVRDYCLAVEQFKF